MLRRSNGQKRPWRPSVRRTNGRRSNDRRTNVLVPITAEKKLDVIQEEVLLALGDRGTRQTMANGVDKAHSVKLKKNLGLLDNTHMIFNLELINVIRETLITLELMQLLLYNLIEVQGTHMN